MFVVIFANITVCIMFLVVVVIVSTIFLLRRDFIGVFSFRHGPHFCLSNHAFGAHLKRMRMHSSYQNFHSLFDIFSLQFSIKFSFTSWLSLKRDFFNPNSLNRMEMLYRQLYYNHPAFILSTFSCQYTSASHTFAYFCFDQSKSN